MGQRRDDGVPVLGMVGAGQLARMTHQAVVGLAVELRVLAGAADDSAALVMPGASVGDWHALADLEHFAAGCDVVTFDHELVDPAHLAALAQAGHVLRPAPAAERFAQDKLHQRTALAAAGFPVPAHAAVDGPTDLLAFGEEHGWPIVAKAVRGGYDGRGVWVLDDEAAARALWDEVAGTSTQLLVEAHVPIVRELAVAVARRPSGEQRAWAVTETVQRDGICVEVLAPAPVDAATAGAAHDLAERLVAHVEGTGVVAVELFQTADGLLVNELALRPHNSVHWTIEGARTSQFANHARAVLDLPLGDTALAAPCAATVNVLGPADGSDPRTRLAAALAVPGVAVHLYGKTARPGRKLGHVTALGNDPDDTRARARTAATALTGEPAGAAD